MLIDSETEAAKLKSQVQFQKLQIEKLTQELYSLRKELQISNKDYQDLYDFNPTALFTIDTHYCIKELNFQAALLLGIDRKFLLNQLFLNYITTFSKSILEKNIQILLQQKLKQTCDLELLQKNGQRKYVETECTLNAKNNLIRICLIDTSHIHILTNRNDALEKSSKLLNQLVHGSNDAIASLSDTLDFKIVTEAFSNAFSKIIFSKITPGCNLIKTLTHDPDLQFKIVTATDRALEEKKAFLIIENAIKKNEIYYCYELAIHTFYNEDNNNEFILKIKDITQEKLQERIQQQSDIGISSRARTMAELASAFAHEINQPLTAINAYSRGCVFLIKNQPSSDLNPLLTPLEKIANQAELAGDIIHNMKNFMREGPLSVEKTDINLLIKDTIALLNYELLDFRLKINLNLTEHLPIIMTNKIHIMQVILNLARNSIEALQSNAEATPELTIETTQLEQKIHINVRDNGPGIPNEFQHKILKTYFTTKKKGTGIGLNICKTLIEEHGGQLTVRFYAQKGAWFTFTLPITHSESYEKN